MRRLVLGIAVAVTSLMPIVGMADDQQIADFIKSQLQAEQQQGNLHGFNVDMRVEQGTVWFKGHVSNAQQEMTILKTAQAAAHLGVLQVVDDIEVTNAQAPAQQAPARQATGAAPKKDYASTAIPAAAPQTAAQQVAYQQGRSLIPSQITSFGGGSGGSGTRSTTATFGGGGSGTRTTTAPVTTSIGSYGNSPMPYASSAPCQGPDCGYSAPVIGAPFETSAPVPIGGLGGGGYGGQPVGNDSPSLPGYAWPSYAAHPNFGNVSYPQQYSPSAWPYIGPFYPYPQVPLGWRKVSLEWDDGFWQLDFHDK